VAGGRDDQSNGGVEEGQAQSDAGAGDEGDAVGESKLPSAGLNGQLVLHDVVAFGPSPRAGDNEPCRCPAAKNIAVGSACFALALCGTVGRPSLRVSRLS